MAKTLRKCQKMNYLKKCQELEKILKKFYIKFAIEMMGFDKYTVANPFTLSR